MTYCKLCSDVPWKFVTDSPNPYLTYKLIWFGGNSMVIITFTGTHHLWHTNYIVVCCILSYNVCVSSDIITASHIIIIPSLNKRSSFSTDSITLWTFCPPYWSGGIKPAFSITLIISTPNSRFFKKLKSLPWVGLPWACQIPWIWYYSPTLLV